jgi:2-octaprenyl-6-methoxyphenol hydroxylase
MTADDTPFPQDICDLAIIGAGPAGATLALAAAQAGFSVTLIDARDPAQTRPDGRNFAIVRGSWRLLESVGVTGDLQENLQPLNGLEATDGGRHWFGAPTALFTNDDLPQTKDDTPLGYMVEAPRLQAALDQSLARENGINWLKNNKFEGLDPHSGFVALTLNNGARVNTRLVAGCDGVNSPVRLAAGITVEGRTYGKSVFAANVTLSRPHHGIARQLFTPEGPFATLPLSGDRANLAWYMKTGAAEMLAARPADEINAELNARFEDFAGKMQLDGPAIAYPLILKIAQDMVAPRIALVGDAARRINPLAGQGLNLGFKDVAALIEVMENGRYEGLDFGAMTVLERYQSWRRFDANATALALDGLDRLFSNDNAVLKPIRGLALMAAQKLDPVRKAMARQASADQDNLPRRMQAKAD